MGLNCLPLDVLLFTLEIRKDVELVKNCRLVSKPWNELCCRILQKLSAVPLKEGQDNGEGLERLLDVLLDRQLCFPPDWPNPFRNYKLLEASFSNPNFVRFIQRPTLRITSMDIVIHDKTKFQRAVFEDVLERHKDSIRNFKIRDYCGSVSFVLGKGGGIVKSVTLKDLCEESSLPCPLVELIARMTRDKKIQQVELEGDLSQTTLVFSRNRNRECWNTLRSLNLTSKSQPQNASPDNIDIFMKWAQELQFPSLTELTVWFQVDKAPNQILEQYSPYLLPLIQKCASGIEELEIPFLPLNSFPDCSKLRLLTCVLRDGDRIQDFTKSKFPSLRALMCFLDWGQVPTFSKTEFDERILNVVSFRVFWPDTTTIAAIETLWSSLTNQFPNLRKVSVVSRMTCSMLHSIRRRLPRLTELALNDISVIQLLGTRAVSSTREKGWNSKDLENCPLIEMWELTNVHFGELVAMSGEVLACVGKLPKVQVLSFHWATTVAEYLANVKTVRIFYKNWEEGQELQKVAETRPNFELLERC